MKNFLLLLLGFVLVLLSLLCSIKAFIEGSLIAAVGCGILLIAGVVVAGIAQKE